MHEIIHIIKHTVIDSLPLLPFLFLTYLLMEFIEHKTSEKSKSAISKAGVFGPVAGGLLGIIPQCGFSAAASSLYSGRIISLGTLFAIFLSTSDEMLPIFLSNKVEISVILKILGVKAAIGIVLGFLVDLAFRLLKKPQKEVEVHSLCEHDHCHCEESIFKSSLIHTVKIFAFIFVINLALNFVIEFIGEDRLSSLFTNTPIVGSALSALVGLIPNCAASVVITELYLSGVISMGAMLAGVLTGSGMGLLLLFRTNKNLRENLVILVTLYLFGFLTGSIFELIGITF